MADTRPTPLPFTRILRLCWWGITSPRRLQAAEEEDDRAHNHFVGAFVRPSTSSTVFQAFWRSLIAVLAAGVIGFSIGILIRHGAGCTPSWLGTTIQAAGGLMLLWGTLFVRGWDIQTLSGVTLSERVNRWLYRGLYCSGTALLLLTLGLAPCPT